MEALGVGLYTLREAARLIRVDQRSLKRWVSGYAYTSPGREGRQRRRSAPLWISQHAGSELGSQLVGFQDLLELRVVNEFVSRGVPLLVVRHCMDAARSLFGAAYPFTARRFVTDGATIFHQALEQGKSEGELLNLRNRQYTFHEIVKSSLYAGIEYEDGNARRWFPDARSRAVVLDPARQFGHPTLNDSGVPTSSIYASFLAEDRQRAVVARLFEIDVRQVDAAVRFEERLSQAN